MQRKPKKGEYLDLLLRSSKTIFSTMDAALLWSEDRKTVITDRLKKYAKGGKLLRVWRGLYAKDNNYNPLELATRINTPCYLSFETVLTREGINFQYYKTLFVASYVNRVMEVDGHKIRFIRMKDYVLSNDLGVDHTKGYPMASKERAFLDRLYVSKDYHFDQLEGLHWEKVFEILPIYHNKRLEKSVNEYFRNYKIMTSP